MRVLYTRVKVVAVAGDRASVAPMARASCDACAGGYGCGADVVFARGVEPGGVPLWVRNGSGLNIGDVAWLGMSARTAWVAATLVFGLPMAGFLAGALSVPGLLNFLELGVDSSNWSAAFGALFGLTIAIASGRYLSTRFCSEHWLQSNLVMNGSYER